MSWLDKQLDRSQRIVASWPEWKREMIKTQIGDIGGKRKADSRTST